MTSELVEQRTRRAADLYSEAQDERQYLEIITRSYALLAHRAWCSRATGGPVFDAAGPQG